MTYSYLVFKDHFSFNNSNCDLDNFNLGQPNFLGPLGAPRETGGAETHAPSLKSLMQLKKKYDAPDVASLPDGYKQNSDKGPVHVIQFD